MLGNPRRSAITGVLPEGQSITREGPLDILVVSIGRDPYPFAPNIERGLECPCRKGCPNCEHGLIRHAIAFCQRPGYITPAEFFYYVQERIARPLKDGPIQRLVFWDLTQMDYRFPLFKEDKMLLPTLLDTFKTKGLKSLFMGAGNAENTRAASAMAGASPAATGPGARGAREPTRRSRSGPR